MRCTSGCRTTSREVKKVKLMPSTRAQHLDGVAQAGTHLARQVGLRDVAGHHRHRAEADARQEHLHLLHRGVLGLVEDDEGVIEVRPRM